eukprot:1191600-Prorocentrum_minimum.AAC.1
MILRFTGPPVPMLRAMLVSSPTTAFGGPGKAAKQGLNGRVEPYSPTADGRFSGVREKNGGKIEFCSGRAAKQGLNGR